jgi:hypothetical protein
MSEKFTPDGLPDLGGPYIVRKKHRIDPDIIVDIEKELADEGATIIHCQYTSSDKYINGGWVNISPTTYLLNKKDNSLLRMTQVNNIAVSPDRHFFTKARQKKTFTLFFPKLPENWDSFSILEVTTEPSPFVKHDIKRNSSGIYQIIMD